MSESFYKNKSLFTTFFKIGAFTLGGGYAMIPLVQREVVDNKKWIPAEEFLDLIALAQSAPGVIAVNTAVFVGYKINGWRGMLSAVIGATLPSFCIILLIATCFTQFRDYPAVEAIFKGIRPAVVALIAAPLYKMGRSAKVTWKTIALPIAAALLIWLCGISPVLIILIAILGGLAFTGIQDLHKKKDLIKNQSTDRGNDSTPDSVSSTIDSSCGVSHQSPTKQSKQAEYQAEETSANVPSTEQKGGNA